MPASQPKQARSRATQTRIIEAALELVERKRWDDISISELARHAHSSVGAFYARFEDKAALLSVLDDYYTESLCAIFADTVNRQPMDLLTTSSQLLRDSIDLHRRRAGLIRTLVLTARTTGSAAYAANTQRLGAWSPVVTEHLMRCTEVPEGCRPEHMQYALACAFSAMREQILFPEAVPIEVPGPRAMRQRLLDVFIGALHALSHR